ncbi:Sperm-tail_PG-rich repeat [Hexamita inflata]|uniref:Sperm-tail PG-rich repeat n=1 Tax=Hexamita inflata TaxID=28002 RepID=A0AA86U279_9EUKA|nr:Sperm-tail PG-rich repeat [Hexamita inflata]
MTSVLLDSGRLPFANFVSMNQYHGSTQMHTCRATQDMYFDFKKCNAFELERKMNPHNFYVPKTGFGEQRLGPGYYNTELSTLNHSLYVSKLPRYEYKAANWSDTLKPNLEIKTRPGPASYHNIRRASAKPTNPQPTEFELDQKRATSARKSMLEANPGPLAYNPVNRKSVKSAHLDYNLRTTKPFQVPNLNVPGANQYIINSLENKKIHAVIYRRERDVPVKNDVPGPGTYLINRDLLKK